MITTRILQVALFLASIQPLAWCDPPAPDRLVVSELPEVFELSVPVSRLVMRIPKNNLKPGVKPEGGATASRRYFLFEDKSKQLYISGWFEPDSGFKGINEFWQSQMKAWTAKKTPAPDKFSFKKYDKWNSVVYFMASTSGNNPHIRANWVQAGTWVDLHISLTSGGAAAEAMADLESVLSNIVVLEKAP